MPREMIVTSKFARSLSASSKTNVSAPRLMMPTPGSRKAIRDLDVKCLLISAQLQSKQVRNTGMVGYYDLLIAVSDGIINGQAIQIC